MGNNFKIFPPYQRTVQFPLKTKQIKYLEKKTKKTHKIADT